MKKFIFAFGLVGILLTSRVQADNTPKVGTQAPGFYRTALGDFEITTLLDGVFPMPVEKLLNGITPAQIQKALAHSFETSPLPTSVNGFLINTGTKLVLVDTGMGKTAPGMGNLVPNLKAAGYQPEQVDEVYLTHMHPDHLGGLVVDNKAVFPNAVLRCDARESKFWLDATERDHEANPDRKTIFTKAVAAVKPYQDAGKFKPFEGDTELVPGVKAVSLYGHTPGHTGYLVESNGKKLMLLGDLLHVALVQFADPSVTLKFDNDSKNSAIARKKIFEQAAKEGFLIGSAHLPYPALGHVRRETKNYSFVPVIYQPVK
jgi:glyoxylase-like metal-dependent hydrolase (beta-lactamase superfamily II)